MPDLIKLRPGAAPSAIAQNSTFIMIGLQ